MAIIKHKYELKGIKYDNIHIKCGEGSKKELKKVKRKKEHFFPISVFLRMYLHLNSHQINMHCYLGCYI